MKQRIVNKVYELRKEKRVTQEEFAKAIGISRQTVIAIEKGNYVPSLLLGFTIAHYFKKPIGEVFIYTYEK